MIVSQSQAHHSLINNKKIVNTEVIYSVLFYVLKSSIRLRNLFQTKLHTEVLSDLFILVVMNTEC